MKKMHIKFAAILCAGGLAFSAHAGTIGMRFDGVGNHQSVTINYHGDAPSGNYFQGTTTQHTVRVGVLNYTVMSTSGAAGNRFSVGDTVQTFCADIFQSAGQSSGSNWKTVTFGSLANVPDPSSSAGPMGTDRSALISVLFAQQFSTAISGTNLQAAAFQLAIWEIIHEESAMVNAASFAATNLDITDGIFHASSNGAAQTLAMQWLEAAWDGWNAGDQAMSLAGAYGDNFQDVILIIPLPAPLLMAGLGLLAIPFLRRRATNSA